MEKKRVREILMGILSTYMVLFLFLDALITSFAFLINREAWFFGIKLDGWPAGLYLAATALAAVFLVVLIIGILLFLALAYATVILWNAANPIPKIPTHISTGTTGEHTIRNNPETIFLTLRPEDPAAPILQENFGGI